MTKSLTHYVKNISYYSGAASHGDKDIWSMDATGILRHKLSQEDSSWGI
jgi:hypothetical protein